MGRLLQVFLLIGRTSALTMSVGGMVKDWLLVGLGVAMYTSPVSRLNLQGYAVTFVSVRFRCRRARLRRHMLSASHMLSATAPDVGGCSSVVDKGCPVTHVLPRQGHLTCCCCPRRC